MRKPVLLMGLGSLISLATAAGTAGSVQPALASEPTDPVGRWLTGNGRGVVEIDRCDGGALCGRIIGLRPDRPTDAPPTDVHGRPQCGLTIITSAVPSGRSEWTGQITNPEDGRIYGARISLDASGKLRLRGYVGVPVFGQTVTWQPFAGRIADQCRIAG